MAAGVPEEAASQGGDLVGELIDAALVGCAGIGGAGGEGAVGAFELPGELDGSGDEEAFDVVAGIEVGGPGVEAGVEGVGVLAGEDGGLGAHAVLQGVHASALAPALGLRAGTPGRVSPVDLGAVGGGGGHGGSSSAGGRRHRLGSARLAGTGWLRFGSGRVRGRIGIGAFA